MRGVITQYKSCWWTYVRRGFRISIAMLLTSHMAFNWVKNWNSTCGGYAWWYCTYTMIMSHPWRLENFQSQAHTWQFFNWRKCQSWVECVLGCLLTLLLNLCGAKNGKYMSFPAVCKWEDWCCHHRLQWFYWHVCSFTNNSSSAHCNARFQTTKDQDAKARSDFTSNNVVVYNRAFIQIVTRPFILEANLRTPLDLTQDSIKISPCGHIENPEQHLDLCVCSSSM